MEAGAPTRREIQELLHPALRKHADTRAESLQNRVADRITAFAGSMVFLYVHIAWFVVWIGLNVTAGTDASGKGKGFDPFPFGLLTMIVSLEAIFLSTFVMISQNRADEKRQVLADNQWAMVQAEEIENRELIAISQQILDLTKAVHECTVEKTSR